VALLPRHVVVGDRHDARRREKGAIRSYQQRAVEIDRTAAQVRAERVRVIRTLQR
jgi:hypothetical protein